MRWDEPYDESEEAEVAVTRGMSARQHGLALDDNPFSKLLQPLKWQKWREGWCDRDQSLLSKSV